VFVSGSACRIDGEKRWYTHEPKTAAATSKPLPTFPWAAQWAACERLWIFVKLEEAESWRGGEEYV